MMLKPFQTCVLLVTVVYCNSKNCCFPDQFDAKVDFFKDTVDATGKQILKKAYFEISFDTSGERVYINKTIQAGNETIRTFTLKLYKKRLQYSVVNNSCTAANLTEWKSSNCIPDNATLMTQYSLAMNSSIVVQDYGWTVEEVSHNMTVHVTGDTCIPVYKQVTGSVLGVTMTSTFKFDNVTPKITDIHVFDVPEICKGLKPNDFNEFNESLSLRSSEELDPVDGHPNDTNDHVQVAFEDVLAEPDGVYSIDFVW